MWYNKHVRLDIRQVYIQKETENDSGPHEIKLSKRFIEWLFRHHDVREFSIHFYDHEEFADADEECVNNLVSWDERIDHCCWIDVLGPGIWNESQESVNTFARECMNDFRKAGHLSGRSWIGEAMDREGNKYTHVYLYGRDIHEFDLHFVLTQLPRPRTK